MKEFHEISKQEFNAINEVAFRAAVQSGDYFVVDLLGNPELLDKYPQNTEHLRKFKVVA